MVLFKINSKVLSKNPKTVTHNTFKVQKTDRTIDGTMVVDIIGIKNKVSFVWDYITTQDLSRLIDETSQTTFQEIEYKENTDTLKKITAYNAELTYTPHIDTRTGNMLWKEVKATFEER